MTQHDPEGLELARQIAKAARGAISPRRPRSGAEKPRDEGLEPLGELVKGLVNDRGWVTQVNLHHLLGQWPTLVGEVNAAHSAPESYADKVLTIRAESTTWATSLRQIAPQLLARLNAALGHGTVDRVVVLGPAAPNWKKGRRSVRGRGPRDTYG